jgi:hypothetical protein
MSTIITASWKATEASPPPYERYRTNPLRVAIANRYTHAERNGRAIAAIDVATVMMLTIHGS